MDWAFGSGKFRIIRLHFHLCLSIYSSIAPVTSCCGGGIWPLSDSVFRVDFVTFSEEGVGILALITSDSLFTTNSILLVIHFAISSNGAAGELEV